MDCFQLLRGDRRDLGVDLDGGRESHREEQVGSFPLDHGLEHVVDE